MELLECFRQHGVELAISQLCSFFIMISINSVGRMNGMKVYSNMLSELKGNTANMIVVDTVNKSLGTFRTHVKKTVAKKVGVAGGKIAPTKGKTGIASSSMVQVKVSKGSRIVDGKLVVKGNRIRLIHFVSKAGKNNQRAEGMKQKKKGVKAKPWEQKSQKLYGGTFIAPIRFGKGDGAGSTLGVFKRKSDNPFPIEQLYGGGSGIITERSAPELRKWLNQEVTRQSFMIAERRINKAMG